MIELPNNISFVVLLYIMSVVAIMGLHLFNHLVDLQRNALPTGVLLHDKIR